VVGFFQNPANDYGRLSPELFRAVRPVVDTGIHSEGWTPKRAVAFFRKEDCIDEPMTEEAFGTFGLLVFYGARRGT
jgi:uncharacterized protein (DUF885 family)